MTPTAFELAQRIKDAGLCRPARPVLGCSEKDIAKIENRFGVSLPAGYKDFLRAMGRHTGTAFSDVLITYPAIIKWHCDAVESFATREVPMPPNRYVFSHRDGMYLFFDIEEGVDDPQISRLGECEVGDTLMNIMLLSEFLELEVQTLLRVREEAGQRWASRESERKKDKSWIEEWTKLAQSPFQAGDVVRFKEDVSGWDAQLGNGSLVTLEEGCQANVYQVYWFTDHYSLDVEIVDKTGCRLLGLLDARENMLELITSAHRLLKSPTWEDFAW